MQKLALAAPVVIQNNPGISPSFPPSESAAPSPLLSLSSTIIASSFVISSSSFISTASSASASPSLAPTISAVPKSLNSKNGSDHRALKLGLFGGMSLHSVSAVEILTAGCLGIVGLTFLILLGIFIYLLKRDRRERRQESELRYAQWFDTDKFVTVPERNSTSLPAAIVASSHPNNLNEESANTTFDKRATESLWHEKEALSHQVVNALIDDNQAHTIRLTLTPSFLHQNNYDLENERSEDAKSIVDSIDSASCYPDDAQSIAPSADTATRNRRPSIDSEMIRFPTCGEAFEAKPRQIPVIPRLPLVTTLTPIPESSPPPSLTYSGSNFRTRYHYRRVQREGSMGWNGPGTGQGDHNSAFWGPANSDPSTNYYPELEPRNLKYMMEPDPPAIGLASTHRSHRTPSRLALVEKTSFPPSYAVHPPVCNPLVLEAVEEGDSKA
jgi:hypothetical protein